MQNVHWLGTGLSSIPGIRRMAEILENFTVWNRTLIKAEKSIDHVNKRNVQAKLFDLENIKKSIKPGDIIISQLPANMHIDIAKICLENNCHFASTSYLSSDMLQLDKYVKEKKLVFINEVGLDPGIDHFFSHLLVKDLKNENFENISVNYESYCGGFPSVPNDFRYKFSWSPVGVIKALNNNASFILNSEIQTVIPYKYINNYKINNENYEAYPNRDSTPYIKEYNFEKKWKVDKFVRGTLRLDGWKTAWKEIFDLLDTKAQNLDEKILKKSEELWSKNKYKDEEEDRVVLYVNLSAKKDSKEIFNKSYFLDERGKGENTAMGKLVSLTLSASVDLIIKNKLQYGIIAAPNEPELIDYYFNILYENKINIKNNI